MHIQGRPPSYFILAGLVFTPVCVPYLRSEYGKDYEYDAPVKLLDKMMHSMAQNLNQEIVVLSQVTEMEPPACLAALGLDWLLTEGSAAGFGV